MSRKVIPLKKPDATRPVPPSPWILGEVFTRDGVDYELVTAGEIKLVEQGRARGPPRRPPRPPAKYFTFSAMPGRWWATTFWCCVGRGGMLMLVHLSIISRQHNDLYDYLRERLAGDGDVRVIKDRRLGERRRKAAPAAAERRRAERRSRPEIDEQLRVRSHAIVAVSSEATPLRDTLTTAPGPVDVRRSLGLSTRARRYTQPSPKRRVGISVATADSAVPAGQGRGTNA